MGSAYVFHIIIESETNLVAPYSGENDQFGFVVSILD